MMFNCFANRGPTKCNYGKCHCQAGFCASEAHQTCLQPIGKQCVEVMVEDEVSCGVKNSVCVGGHCMCAVGHHLSGKECVDGVPTPEDITPGFTPILLASQAN